VSADDKSTPGDAIMMLLVLTMAAVCVIAVLTLASAPLLSFADRMGWTPCIDGSNGMYSGCKRPDQRLPTCECVR
jgi:hypothetical protein